MRRLLALLMIFTVMAAMAGARVIPWRVPQYSLTARTMPVREALDTFGVAQGIPVLSTDAVAGTLSGNFKDVPATEFLDRLSTVNNLTWYYDGAAIYVTGASETLSTLIDLKYMKAGEVRAMLNELGVEDARFPIKTASNDELIMVSGPPRYVQLVGEMIAKADKLREQRTFTELETRLFPLHHTWADSVSFSVSSPESTMQIRGVSDILREMMGNMQNNGARDGTNDVARSDDKLKEQLSSGVQPVICADNRLNAVMVRDVSTRMPMYERIIRDLDVPQKLVEINVTVLEMTRENALDWQLSLKVQGTHKHIEGAAGQNAQNLFTPASLAGQGLAGAATYLGRDFNVAAALSALRTKGKARNISRTSLVTMNNLAAEISDQQSYHARVVGENVASLESVSAGTRLQLKPRILPPPHTNAQHQVWVSMVLQDGGFETVTVDAMPMNRTSTLTTQAAIYEGESILLAGYLRDVDDSSGWGIPYLRDIPIIGWIFGGASTTKETVQRMFILTPHVLDLEIEDLARIQATKHRDIRDMEQIQENLEESDDDRELREQNIEERRERRREKVEDALKRRSAEIDHSKEVRQLDRKLDHDDLAADKLRWKEEVKAEIKRLDKVEKERGLPPPKPWYWPF